MASTDRQQIRQDSMRGTVLLLLAVIAFIAYPFFGLWWLLILGVVLIAPAIMLLARAGRKVR